MNMITQITFMLYSVSITWMIYQRMQSYPNIGRFEMFKEFIKWKITKKNEYELDVNYLKYSFYAVILSWIFIFFLLSLTSISLYFLDMKIGDSISFLQLVSIPFLYLLIPIFASRIITSLVFLAVPDDYFWYKEEHREVITGAFLSPGFRKMLEKNLDEKNYKWFVMRRNIKLMKRIKWFLNYVQLTTFWIK